MFVLNDAGRVVPQVRSIVIQFVPNRPRTRRPRPWYVLGLAETPQVIRIQGEKWHLGSGCYGKIEVALQKSEENSIFAG